MRIKLKTAKLKKWKPTAIIGKETIMPKDRKDRDIEQVKESIGMDDQETDDGMLMESEIKKLQEINSIFKFPLGCKVRNRHNETGYVEMCGLDYRGTIYLVSLPEGLSRYYTESEIKLIPFDPENKDHKKSEDPRIQTDIPDHKKPNEIISDTPIELG